MWLFCKQNATAAHRSQFAPIFRYLSTDTAATRCGHIQRLILRVDPFLRLSASRRNSNLTLDLSSAEQGSKLGRHQHKQISFHNFPSISSHSAELRQLLLFSEAVLPLASQELRERMAIWCVPSVPRRLGGGLCLLRASAGCPERLTIATQFLPCYIHTFQSFPALAVLTELLIASLNELQTN
jgi:hypothetical protein